jgi:aarF domain-containing kinase
LRAVDFETQFGSMKRVFLNSRMAAVVLLMLDLLVLDSFRFYTGKWGARMPDNLTFRTTTSPSATISQVSELYKETDSARLKKARLRLAEVQGRIPMGASELSEQELADMKLTDSPSKIREIAWKVAEPEVKYDPALATSRLFYQPLVWIERNLKIFVPLTAFVGRLLLDVVTNQEEARRTQRANELLQILGDQSPALIKAGQSLSSRSDLLPAAYLEALQKLQDRCPPYPTAQAMALFEAQLGLNFNDVFELDSPEPIAAASIGQVCIVYCAMLARVLTYLRLQVYKARLRSNGAYVAIKIQRPHCEESVAVDLFVLRWYAMRVQSVFTLLKRDVNLTSVVDDFGELLYRELDYRAEALNAQRFAELYASFKDVFVPKIYTSLSTSKVLVMEWVDGVRLSDATAITAMGYNSSRFVDTLVQVSFSTFLLGC